MRYLLAILFVFTCAQVRAQVNYVLNPSFEDYSQCPNAFDQVEHAYHWSAIDSSGPGPCFPEYCNVCSTFPTSSAPGNGFFYQHPRTGNGVMDIQVLYDESTMPPPFNLLRDYLQGRLYEPLIGGTSYCVTFWVSLADKSNYSINRIGAYLDDGLIDTTSSCGFPQTQYTPQVAYNGMFSDTMNWTKVQGSFTANGTERFITIGNFYDLANTAHVDIRPGCIGGCHYSWIVVDDVSVIESNLDAWAGNDTTINEGDIAFIGRIPEIGLECKWYVNGGVIDSGAGIWVDPTVTTTYVVEQTLCGLVKTDTVTVTVIPVGVYNITYSQQVGIYPNPAMKEIVVKQKKHLFTQAIIYNQHGQQVSTQLLNAKETKLDISELPVGVYHVSLEGESGKEVRRFVKM